MTRCSGLKVGHCCGCGEGRSGDSIPIQEPPCTTGRTKKKKKKKKKEKEKRKKKKGRKRRKDGRKEGKIVKWELGQDSKMLQLNTRWGKEEILTK